MRGLGDARGDNAREAALFLLDRVSFRVRAGRGARHHGCPSGAGKSTMLSAIAGRSDRSVPPVASRRARCSSTARRAPPAAPRRCRYVMQDDVFLEALSVQETLEFAAALKLGGDAASAAAARTRRCARSGSASARACGSAT